MPDTPGKNVPNFKKEGLSFPPPASGKAGPKPPARPVPPIEFDQSPSPAARKRPERRSVPPRGYGPKPAAETPKPAEKPPLPGTPFFTDDVRLDRPGAPKPGAGGPAAKPDSRPGPFKVKMRRRPRAFTGFLAGVLYVLIVLGLSFWLGSTAWSWAIDVLALRKTPVEAAIIYTEDMTTSDLARLFKQKGLIEYEWLFRLYCDFSNAQDKISPGEYVIKADEDSSAKDYRALVHMMTPGSLDRAQVSVTFREGLTMEQIFTLLEEHKVAPFEELEEAAATINWRYAYLRNLPAVPSRLEGYLFPDTYTFYVNESPVSALQKFVREFDRRLTAEMREHVEASRYTLHELMIIASMVEAESGADLEERKNIASVIYNRLENWDNPLLQIDATLLVFMEGRRVITADDMSFDHPYNTYLYPGLPPGPICSPSIDSIRAALYPNSTRYYYYLLDDDDVTQFSRTYEEHAEKRASYDRYN